MTERAIYGDIGELRGLWRLVFGDDDRFLDRFFQNLFDPGECLITRLEGRVTSMLFMLGATWSGKEERPMRYIYACATHPDHRGQGLMGELLMEAIAHAAGNGLELALVPASEELFSYYRRFGFTKETYLYRRAYPPLAAAKDASAWQTLPDGENAVELLTELRERFWRGQNAVLWPEAHLRVALGELFSQGGEFLVMKTGNRLPFGYALALPQGGKVKVVECASILSQDETVTSLRNHYKENETLFSLSAGVAGSCAEMPYALLHTAKADEAPYLNLALDL